ncbi:uncharacterized protein LOC103314575 isoform X1 [Tribolium castaneum]|nr:PREDICTED: uncharacterized protein LOC103314575 isoform X1 [Tribolium castaneum]|eukprot:XP_008199200.1 PREDICTED: uncharacterized protein LOC103314575 isoform X1 [Tribolium castaneum]
MGRRPCAVLNCVEENRIRHRFPNPDKFPDRFQKWLFLCGKKKLFEKDPELVYRSLRVCHAHFKPEDRTTNMFIRKECLPELFLPPPLQLVAKSSEEERKDSAATGLPEKIVDECDPKTLTDKNFVVNLETFEPEPIVLTEHVTSESSETEDTLFCDKVLDTVENANSSSVDYVMSTPLEKPYFRSIKNFPMDSHVTTDVCRICFRFLTDQETVQINEGTNSDLVNIEHMLKTVLPALDLNVCSNKVICLQCSDLVNHSFNLNTLWLLTEQKLQTIIGSKKNKYNPEADLIIVTKSEVEEGSEETIIKIEHDHAYEKQAQTLPVVLVSNGNGKISYHTKTKKITRKSQWGSGPYICEICGALYHQIRAFRRHIWNHNRKNTTNRKQEHV